MAQDIAGLRGAGYSERTRHDDLLRRLLGEQRWAAYEADPARIAAAAAITDGDRAGYDMPALLAKVIHQRRWENDDHSPSQSVARVLYYRVTREMATTLPRPASPAIRQQAAAPADRGDHPTSRPVARGVPRQPATSQARFRPGVPVMPRPGPFTFYDAKLRELLGESRWQQLSADPGLSHVRGLISRAHDAGRDVSQLLATAVTSRPFEDDPVSPARSIADVLHYRIQRELARPEPGGPPRSLPLPDQVADVLAHGTAPAGAALQNPRSDPAAPQGPPSARATERPSDRSATR
jgi:hypothetical protein